MRFRAFFATTFVLGTAAAGFAGCGIPAESNADRVRGESGAGGSSNKGGAGGAGGAKAGAAGSGTSGKAGTSAGGKGGGTTGSPCKSPADCDDDNDCTVDSCLATGCSYSPLLPGSACDTNRDKCDGVGNCQGDTCVIDPKTKIDAADDDKCTEDLCDPLTGEVTNPPLVKPSDSTLCTEVFCDPVTGTKKIKDLSKDPDPCTFDECDLSVGPINLPRPVGDGDPCTIDSCEPMGDTYKIVHKPIVDCKGCQLSDSAEVQAKLCDDGKPCTIDRCVQGPSGPTCESEQVPNNTEIDSDGTRCNGTVTCVNGVAKTLNIPPVDDGKACTVDTCDPQTGAYTNVAKPDCIDCDTVADCPDAGGQCRSYKCDNKICVLELATGPTCDDTYACTTGDRCAFGLCVGLKTASPTDNDACTTNDRCTEPNGEIIGDPLGNGCISCMGTDTSPCGDPTGGTLDAECVASRCNGGKCDRTFAPQNKECGDEPSNVCEVKGRCNGAGKCLGLSKVPNCCLSAADCPPPSACKQEATCNASNRCVAGGAVDCGAPICDPVEKQRVVTSTCVASPAPGSCQPKSDLCTMGRVCENGKCEACNAGAADERCKSGYCKKGAAGCCPTSPPVCNPGQECRITAADGCPSCVCGSGTCQLALPGGAGGMGNGGASSVGGAGGAPTNHVCR